MKKGILVSVVTTLVMLVIAYQGYHAYRHHQKQAKKYVPQFLVAEADWYREDDIVGFVHQPNAKRVRDWPEHPKGEIVFKTNNMGFREDSETSTEKAAGVVRVLVTGDSHTDGVVYNDESFPNRLEAILNAEAGQSRFEVINGGSGYYGPLQYYRFAKKYFSLKPDIYIVAIYMGNDILDAAALVEQQEGGNKRPDGYYELLKSQASLRAGAVWQGLNQIYYFKTFPHMVDKSLDRTANLFAKIKDLCDEQDIPLLVVLIPTKVDVEWASDREVLDQIKAGLSLSDDDVRLNERIKDRLAQRLAAMGIDYVDVLDDMRNDGRKMFWISDYHLDVSGHELIARKLLDQYKDVFLSAARK
jgi:hypothetical protein